MFLLGAMVMFGYEPLAIGLGVVTAAVLAYKQPLHGFVEKLGWDDVYAGVRLLIATFIALPLLPERARRSLGRAQPLQAVAAGDPDFELVAGRLCADAPARAEPGRRADRIVGRPRLVHGGHLVLRQGGPRQSANRQRAACGILLAWAVMFVRVLVLVAVVNRPLLAPLLIPFLAMAVVVAGFAALLYYRDGSTNTHMSAKGEVAVKNPFSLTAAAKFAALFAVVLLAVKIVQQTMPPSGLYAVAALSGLVDVDAITLSMAELAQTGEAQMAVVAIAIAALSNTLVKCGMAVVLAGLALGKPILIATAATLLAGLVAVLLLSLRPALTGTRNLEVSTNLDL